MLLVRFDPVIFGPRKMNSISRKTKDHLPNNDKAARTYFLEKTEPYFLVIFTAESGPRSMF